MKTIRINFAKHQKLPIGYHVEWWECDEMYHFVIQSDPEYESPAYCSRWMAYRAAKYHQSVP